MIGIAFGYFQPGRQDKSQLFKKGLLWGLVVAIVVALLGWALKLNPLGLGDVGFLGILWAAIVLSILFIVGVWLGDWIEGRRVAPRRVG